MNILLLASKSASRKRLLTEAQIPFCIIDQHADETVQDRNVPLEELVKSIALQKMDSAILPAGNERQEIFVLTADTMSQDSDGTINGKPTDRADAIAKIKRARSGSNLCTAFVLDRKTFLNGAWNVDRRIIQSVISEYQFIIPDYWIETYLDKSLGLSASNAIAVEEYGAQFLKVVHGSYSAIVGLPMFEVREALENVDFFKF